MLINKLSSSKITAPSLVKLTKEEGLILLSQNNKYTCIHFNSKNVESLLHENEFDSCTEFRFIGNSALLDKLLSLNLKLNSKLKNKVIINDKIEVWFFPNEGKIRIPNNTPAVSSAPKVKRVLIIDDSPVIQKLLCKVIESSDKFVVSGMANCPSEAKKIIESDPPDLITLDIHMPEMTGVDFLKSYLKYKNIPVMMISSVSISEGPLVMEALSNGASTFIQKPSLGELSVVAPQIIEKLESLGEVKKIFNGVKTSKTSILFSKFDGLIAIGSSTGGTQALEVLFTSMPDNIPPIVVVQHIPAVFSKALADRLNNLCKFEVKEGCDGDLLKANTVYIAPGGKQMKVAKRGPEQRIIVNDSPPVNRFRPSVDYLFNGLLEIQEKNLTAVILTGMGSDGAQGMLQLFKNGAHTIAQDEASCVVYGMPRAAIELGAASRIVSIEKMAETIILEHNKHKALKAS